MKKFPGMVPDQLPPFFQDVVKRFEELNNMWVERPRSYDGIQTAGASSGSTDTADRGSAPADPEFRQSIVK